MNELETSSSAGKQSIIGSAIMGLGTFLKENADVNHPLIDKFAKSTSADEQLRILKSIINDGEYLCDHNTVKFLASVFYETPAKHPVKCFLTKHITRCTSIQEPFIEFLSTLILSQIVPNNTSSGYKQYGVVVPKVLTCIENFPAGAAAVKRIDVKLCEHLLEYLRWSKEEEAFSNQQLHPVAKTDMYNLYHCVVRILVHIVQKWDSEDMQRHEKSCNLFQQPTRMIHCMEMLISDDDVPMDTKCLSGILLMHFEKCISNDVRYWCMWLEMTGNEHSHYGRIMKHRAGQLSVYAAIAVLIPMEVLQEPIYHMDKDPAILQLLHKLLRIPESDGSEQALTVGVARALVQLSKSLGCITVCGVGARVVEALLQFVWPHLDHHVDSVRHLALQTLAAVIAYCKDLEDLHDDDKGDPAPLAALLTSLRSVGRSKSFYWGVSRAATALGAPRVLGAPLAPMAPHTLRALCTPLDLLRAALDSHLHAAAMGAIEALLAHYPKETEPEEIFSQWVLPTLDLVQTADGAALQVLEGVLTKTMHHHPQVVHHIGTYSSSATAAGARSALLCARAARRLCPPVPRVPLAVPHVPCVPLAVPHALLLSAALRTDLQTRILALSLVVESRKSTQSFTEDELTFVLQFLRYNINALSHNFRHLMLANIKKLLKRMEDSWQVLSRRAAAEGCAAHYVVFWRRLRALCYCCALPDAHLPRRAAALQLLAWLHGLPYTWEWQEEHVEILLQHLDDTYEANTALALEILQHCPQELLQSGSYSTSLKLSDIVQQARSLKPADSASAACKLQLLLDKLPHYILQGNEDLCNDYNGHSGLRSAYTLIQVLLNSLMYQIPTSGGAREAAARGGVFGVLHCLASVVGRPDVRDELWRWSPLCASITDQCVRVINEVEEAVSHNSPEGRLPPQHHPHPYSWDPEVDDKPITAQMVLVCAWRSVKEASCVLGRVCAAIPACTDEKSVPREARLIMEQLVRILQRAQHRGAVEQAAAGLALAANRFWRDPELAQLVEPWVRRALATIEDESSADRHATRRGAGLPFMIQSLVSSELAVSGRGECARDCFSTLLRLAAPPSPASPSAPPAAPTTPAIRTLAANVLRALFRHAGLESAVHPYVGEGLRIAIRGFEADTWPERTSMSLLFGALHVRAFGVGVSRGTDVPHHRNTCSAGLFYRRYPALYPLMLSIVTEAAESSDGTVRPCLFPVLLLLARLYPSALEGTDSNLKLSPFVPLLVRCAAADTLAVRAATALALRPLVLPTKYVEHLEWMFRILSDSSIKRNQCHGLLLQVCRLLESPPSAPQPSAAAPTLTDSLCNGVRNSLWILEQCLGGRPCFVIADEYVKVINLLVWRFPEYIEKDTIASITSLLKAIMFTQRIVPVTTGRDLCLSNCLYLYLILLHKGNHPDLISQTTQQTLQHSSHEVVAAALNYCLMLHGHADNDTKMEQHLDSIRDAQVLTKLRQTHYLTIITEKFHGSLNMDCRRKCLRLLTLEKDTQRDILNQKDISDEEVIRELICYQDSCHDTMTHLYLESLLNFAEGTVDGSNGDILVLNILCAVLKRSSAGNSEETRLVVVSFLENNLVKLMTTDLDRMEISNKFTYKSYLLATLVTLIEDDNESIRQRAANVAAKLSLPSLLRNVTLRDVTPGDVTLGDVGRAGASLGNCTLADVTAGEGDLLPSVCCEMLREFVESLEDSAALFLMLALLDFNSEVDIADEIGDECRVFDQGERHNIHLEETVWTSECADKIIKIQQQHDVDLVNFVLSIIKDKKYMNGLQHLCKENIILFEEMANDNVYKKDRTIYPKIELFVRKLRFKC